MDWRTSSRQSNKITVLNDLVDSFLMVLIFKEQCKITANARAAGGKDQPDGLPIFTPSIENNPRPYRFKETQQSTPPRR